MLAEHIPALMVAHIAIGYHIVLVENKLAVSSGPSPYSRVRAALRSVDFNLTSAKSIRSFVIALI